ncbi:MAG TPA: aminopeptidase P N-terminal domain-containing protein, partial [Thermoanaerobaculia bacterium]|nr:aminopeptidase P N-terminal domain-containing protein [Thermoanaerobaculia bacterium]
MIRRPAAAPRAAARHAVASAGIAGPGLCAALLLAALVAAPAALAQALPPVPPPVPAAEYAARRARVAEAIGPDALLLLVSPAPAPRNGDVSWPFRQDDDLLYLTGAAGPRTALALLPGEEHHRAVLFAPDADPLDELWTGPVASHEELAAATGIDEVVSIDELPGFLAAALSGRPWGESDLYRYFRPPATPRFSAAVAAGRATVWLALGNRGFGSGGALEALWEPRGG